jgi:hypothetical protein
MTRINHQRALGPLGLLDVVLTSLGLMGCPGSLDPALLASSGSGGTSGGSGMGGTGTCDVTAIFTSTATTAPTGCATSGCHDTADATLYAAGLDLTLNDTIGSRLVGVASPGTSPSSAVACAGKIYLDPMSNPATGLLIDKITLPNNSPNLCGSAMPFPGVSRLSAAQQTCVEQWAEGLIVAAGTQ